MFSLLAGIVIGFLLCLYYLVQQNKKQSSSAGKSYLQGKSLYCNFLMIDKSEAIKQGVEEKLQSKIGSGFLRDKLINKVGQIAVEKISDEKISQKILEKLLVEIPVKISELGITTEAVQVYCRESIFILKLTLLNVDMQQIITKKAGEEKANKIEEMFKFLGGQWAKDTVGSQLFAIKFNKNCLTF